MPFWYPSSNLPLRDIFTKNPQYLSHCLVALIQLDVRLHHQRRGGARRHRAGERHDAVGLRLTTRQCTRNCVIGNVDTWHQRLAFTTIGRTVCSDEMMLIVPCKKASRSSS